MNHNLKAVCVAWTGIASLLLPGGTTCHWAFLLPFILSESSNCGLDFASSRAQRLRNAHVIIWDEVAMANKYALGAVDKFLQRLMGNNIAFGGKIMVFGGDLMQLLPVLPRASKEVVAAHSPVYASVWNLMQVVHFVKNTRAENDAAYAHWLLLVGSSTHVRVKGLPHNMIEIPQHLIVTLEGLKKFVFGKNAAVSAATCAILTPKNADAFAVNKDILNSLPGEEVQYISIDKLPDEYGDKEVYIPLEYLHDLTPSGMPPHVLHLKIGAIVILLRNLDILNGMCNGTRLKVLHFNPNVLHLEVITGIACGERVHLPRMWLECSGSSTPTPFSRLQFPIRLAFAITINKSQGQTLDRVGIMLQEPVFSHGALYVAMSRVRSEKCVRFYIKEGISQGKRKGKVVTINEVNLALLERARITFSTILTPTDSSTENLAVSSH